MRTALLLLTIFTASLALPRDAEAHAMLKRASPRVGSTVAKAPDAVRLWFSEALEPTFSTVQVLDSSGARIDRDDKHLDSKDHALMEISLPQLKPGTYKVIWHALSVDTHATDGSFTFTVAP
jgi:methionine-rich copper-binding protein CopC